MRGSFVKISLGQLVLKPGRGFYLCAVFLAGTGSAFSALPPKYLGVSDFKKCLAEKQQETMTSVCLPTQKPKMCLANSWRQLQALKGKDAVSPCLEKQDHENMKMR
jgi:hypothetical protein